MIKIQLTFKSTEIKHYPLIKTVWFKYTQIGSSAMSSLYKE